MRRDVESGGPHPPGGKCDCSWELVTSLLLRIIGAVSGSGGDQCKCEQSVSTCSSGLAAKGAPSPRLSKAPDLQKLLCRATDFTQCKYTPCMETLFKKVHTNRKTLLMYLPPNRQIPQCRYSPQEEPSNTETYPYNTAQRENTLLKKFRSM